MPVQMSTAFIHSVQQRLDDVLATPEASTIIAERKAKSLCHYYQTLIPSDKSALLSTLARDYGVDQEAVLQYASQLSTVSSQERNAATLLRTEERIRNALTPKYQQLFTQISRLEHGVKFLVDLRADLLHILTTIGVDQDNPYLQTMSSNLRNLLSLWFSVGFLKLERITWESPCDILQKISDYEAVHPIRNWTDLRRRVGPYRRCYVFTHGSMPREPVVVLHTALTTDISDSIQAIVASGNQLSNSSGESADDISPANKEDTAKVDTAIFYSITSTQKGLQGVELGNYLIKNAVKELLTEFPHMCQFSSLSPIPGFRDWLIGEINKTVHRKEIGEGDEGGLFTPAEISAMRSVLEGKKNEITIITLKRMLLHNDWHNSEPLCLCLKEPLMRLCARYLLKEKRRNFALNPVANFHLRNGAVVWRINWLADTSVRGLSASCGMMVNYRYYLEETEEYSKRYMNDHVIKASAGVLELLDHKSRRQAKSESSEQSSSAGSRL